MSANLLLDYYKPWLNARVNNLTVDGTINGGSIPPPTSIPLSSLQTSTPGVLIDDGTQVTTSQQLLIGSVGTTTSLQTNGTLDVTGLTKLSNTLIGDPLNPVTLDINTNNFNITGDVTLNGTLSGTVTNDSITTGNLNDVLTTVDIGGNLTATWQPITVAANYKNTITVAKSGGDYTNLVDAINAAVLLNPTAFNHVLIIMYPGIYFSAQTITVPSYIDVVSHSTTNNSNVVIQDTIVLSNESSISGVKIEFINVSSSFVRISFCYIVELTATLSSIVNINDCVFLSDTIARPYAVSITDSTAFISNTYFRAVVGVSNYNDAIVCTNSTMFMDSCNIIDINNGVYLLNSICNVNSGRSIRVVSKGFVADVTSRLNMLGHEIIQGLGSDIINDGSLYVQGSRMRFDKLINNGTFYGQYFNDQPGQLGIQIDGQTTIGNIYNPSQLSVGYGDSHILGMRVFHCISTSVIDTGSNFVEITNSVIYPGNTNASTFSSATVNQCLLIGSENATFTGIQIVNNVAAPGTYLFEYYNGAQFVTCNLMSTDAESPYLQHSDSVFSIGSYQYRFGYKSTDLVKSVINGINAYWFRFKVLTITSNGTVEQIKLHPPARLEINRDGFMEIFNDDSYRVIPFSANNSRALGAVSPGNRDIYLSQQPIGVGFSENNFNPNADNVIGYVLTVPTNMDTSKPMFITLRYCLNIPTVGDTIIFETSTAVLRDELDDAGPASDIFTTLNSSPLLAGGFIETKTVNTVSYNTGKYRSMTFSHDVSSLITKRNTGSGLPDSLIYMIKRKGTVDNYQNSVVVVDILLKYSVWSG